MSAYACIYCGKSWGNIGRSPFSSQEVQPSVCDCVGHVGRDEAREIAAGLRPWAENGVCLGKRADPEVRRAAQERWDAQQRWIAEHNNAHAGGGVGGSGL